MPSEKAMQLAEKILYECVEVHGSCDRHYSKASAIIDTALAEARDEGIEESDQHIGALWSDLFDHDQVVAGASFYFDHWRNRIRALKSTAKEKGESSMIVCVCQIVYGYEGKGTVKEVFDNEEMAKMWKRTVLDNYNTPLVTKVVINEGVCHEPA
jgi:hydroxylamine reductase (hybrid-cluster protein)